MKKIFIVIDIILIMGFAYAQKISDTEVPAEVKEKFSILYPDNKVQKWTKEDGNYEAQFDYNTKAMCVEFDAKGKLVEIEESVANADLPIGINEYVKKNYDIKKMSEAAKITSILGIVTYEVEVKNMYLVFDKRGGFIKSKTEEREGRIRILKYNFAVHQMSSSKK